MEIDVSVYAMDMVDETNPIEAGYHEARTEQVFLSLSELAARGGRVTRVRWLMERGLADLSYVHGVLPDGTPVHVRAAACFLIPRREMKGSLIRWAQGERVYAKGLGLLDEGNWSVLS